MELYLLKLNYNYNSSLFPNKLMFDDASWVKGYDYSTEALPRVYSSISRRQSCRWVTPAWFFVCESHQESLL